MTDATISALEAKSAEALPAGHEVATAYDEFMRSFEAFKETNDERLSQIERRAASDPVTEEKMARLSARLDEQLKAMDEASLKGARPRLGGQMGGVVSPAAREHKSAFTHYVRAGEADGLRRLEEKALSVGSGPDGGYLVPDETEREIGRRLSELSPIRAIASVRQVSSAVYRKPFSVSGPAVGWVAETAVRPELAAGTLAELQYPAMELYAMPAATQSLIDDAAVNIDQWLAEEVEVAFAEQETAAFVNGDGVAKPRGFLDYPTVSENVWAWGSLGTVASGADGAFAVADPADRLVDLVYALKSGYRQNASFVTNRRTQAEIRKLKDADGTYLWQPSAQAGGRASLMNFPIVEVEDMPDIGIGSASIAFGDFRRGYLVVDRTGVRVLRDPYSAKPYVLFYTTKRVGGGVHDFDAIKLMTFAAG